MGSRSCNAYGCEREVPTIPGRACLSAATSGGACRQEGEGGAERARGRTARRRAVQALGWWQGWVRSTLDEDAARWWCWGEAGVVRSERQTAPARWPGSSCRLLRASGPRRGCSRGANDPRYSLDRLSSKCLCATAAQQPRADRPPETLCAMHHLIMHA